MSVTIAIQLAGGWVLKHRENAVLPIDFLKQHIQAGFSGTLIIQDSNLTELYVGVVDATADVDGLVDKLRDAFCAHYEISEGEGIFKVNLLSPKGKDESSAGAPKDLKIDEQIASEARGLAAEEAPQPKTLSDVLGGLVSGEEFKLLVKELEEIAPQIIQNKTADTFTYQTYIFSINDGHGLSTYLSLFSKLLDTLNVKPMSPNVLEEKLAAPKGEEMEPFSDVLRILRRGKKDACQILCIDISEWMNAVNSRVFKEFLLDVERHMEEFIIIFRVPFVDKEVLAKIQYALNDLMFVRTVSFPPFTKDELQRFAQLEFEKYGFKMSAAAWEGFHERISEEKSDGKFYGMNTVKKVVRELLYKKQLANARKGKNDFSISKRDAEAICANAHSIGLSGYEMLDKLVGGDVFRDRINEIIAQIEMTRADPSLPAPCIHMRFVGNPGTGKTTVARIVGKILKEKGVLRIGNFYEYAGRDFCGRYIGETAPKTASMCRDAYGSVLFIDEAYSLYRGDGNDRDYGREALDTLIAEMENHRSDLVVIMAGYTDDMEILMQGNAGLASRMPYVIEFPNFTREQLYDIFVSMLKGRFKYDEDLLPAVKTYFESIPDEIINAKEFSNARFVRNLFERTWAKASMRCQLNKITTIALTRDDFDRSTSDKEFTFIMKKKKNKIGFAD